MATQPQKIGLTAATVIGINAMIGAGIFAMPASLSGSVGPAGIFSYLLSGLLVLSIVIPLGRLAYLYPGEGWGYRYPAQWGGHQVGVIASLSYVLGVIVAMGFLVQQLGVWLTQYLAMDPLLIGNLILALTIVLVLAGTEVSSWGQYVIAFCVLVPLVLIGGVCWLNFQPGLLTPFAPHGWSAVGFAMPTVLFSLLGFESIASLYSVVDKPEKNVPLAAILAVLIVVGIFIFFVAGALFAIPAAHFTQGVNRAIADVLVSVYPQYTGMRLIGTIGAFFAIFGTLHSMIWSIALLLRDTVARLRFDVVQRLYKKGQLNGTSCVLAVGVITSFCSFTLQAKSILQVTPLLIVPTYIFALVALLFNREEWRRGYNILTVCAILLSSALVYVAGLNIIG